MSTKKSHGHNRVQPTQTAPKAPKIHQKVELEKNIRSAKNLELNIKVYELYRKRIEHQDILVQHRTTFQLVAQGALMAAYFQVANPSTWRDHIDAMLPARVPQNTLLVGIAAGGFGLSMFGFAGAQVARTVRGAAVRKYLALQEPCFGEGDFGYGIVYAANFFPAIFWV